LLFLTGADGARVGGHMMALGDLTDWPNTCPKY